MTLLLPEHCTLTTARDVVHHCDALTYLRALPDGFVNCIVTSPPYFGLRDYQVAGQIGLEATPQAFVATMVHLFREARRVLRDDGVLWVNLGDSYVGGGGYAPDAPSNQNGGSLSSRRVGDAGGRTQGAIKAVDGLRSKNLLGIPWRVAFGLQDDGWILRSDIIWHKPNPMPESVTDRPTKSHEYVFLFSKQERYWYDADAIREDGAGRLDLGRMNSPARLNEGGLWSHDFKEAAGRNKRTVWTIATEPTPFAHFATFPQKLIEPMILAGCPHKVCAVCGAPWVRQVEVSGGTIGKSWVDHSYDGERGLTRHGSTDVMKDGSYTRQTLGFLPQCTHNADTRPGITLDPFMGSGTTALVARRLGRHYIGSELNRQYALLARERLAVPYTPMFAEMLTA